MKTFLFLMTMTSLFSFQVMAGGYPSNDHPNKYCAREKSGKTVVMHEGKAITSDETLADGTKIQPDGKIIKKDGTVSNLNAGECIGHDGKIIMENAKKKPARSNY